MGLSGTATIRTLTKQLDEARSLVNTQAEQINTQAEQIKTLAERITQLENELAKAKKDSSTSSKPPSSDIVNPKKAAKKKRKRKPGGQKGHPKHERPSFPPDSLNDAWEYTLASCPLCGVELEDADRAPRVVQQVEIIEVPIRIEEHRGRAYWCPSCRKFHYAPLPPEVEQGQLFGPRLTTLVAYMKGVCHASFSTIRKFIRDVIGVTVSRGYLRNFRFITTPGIEPTNHLAEQAIRFVVIDRRITQGTRSESGREWCQRIWTTIATCTQRGLDVFEFLRQSLLSHWRGTQVQGTKFGLLLATVRSRR